MKFTHDNDHPLTVWLDSMTDGTIIKLGNSTEESIMVTRREGCLVVTGPMNTRQEVLLMDKSGWLPSKSNVQRTGWMIEHQENGHAFWWKGEREYKDENERPYLSLDFTNNPNDAVVFPTRECAELVLYMVVKPKDNRFYPHHLSVTEHSWLSA